MVFLHPRPPRMAEWMGRAVRIGPGMLSSSAPVCPVAEETKLPTNLLLLATMEAFADMPTRETARAFYHELVRAMLLVPELGDLASRAAPLRTITTSTEKVTVRTVPGPNGKIAIPAFTDTEHLLECFPNGSLVIALPAPVVARWVVADPSAALILNPTATPRAGSALPIGLVEWVAQGLLELPEPAP
jgi:hypothetical protein